MPMIDVTLPEGALSDEQRNQLGERLTNTILKWEGAAEIPFSRQITAVYFDERPAGSIYIAGEQETQPRYRVLVTIPEGSIKDDERKAGLVEEVTRDRVETRWVMAVADAQPSGELPRTRGRSGLTSRVPVGSRRNW